MNDTVWTVVFTDKNTWIPEYDDYLQKVMGSYDSLAKAEAWIREYGNEECYTIHECDCEMPF